MSKKISIIGSTGSIGTQTLEIVRENEKYEVVALACGRNIRLMESQMREFHPSFVAVADKEAAEELRAATKDLGIPVEYGMDGLVRAAAWETADITVTGIVGMVGIRPTLAAIEAGKDIALANKETLVTAGHLVMKAARRSYPWTANIPPSFSAFREMRGIPYPGSFLRLPADPSGERPEANLNGLP